MALQRSRDRPHSHRLLPPQPPPPQPPPPMVHLPLAAVQYHHQQRQQQHHQVQGMYQRGDVLHAAAPAAVPVLADLALAAYRQRASGISMADQHAAVLLAQRMQAAGWDERSFRHVQATPVQRIDTGNTSVHASRIDASVISDGSGRFSDSRVASVVPSYRTVEKQDMASVHGHRPGHERNVYWQPTTNMYSTDVTSRNYQRNLSPQSTHFRTQGNERYFEANGHYNSRSVAALSGSRSQSDREVRKRSRERERERSPIQRAQRFPRIPEHRSGKQGYGRKVYPYIDSTFDRSKKEDEDREDGQVTPPAKSPDMHEDRRRKLSHNTRVPDYTRSQASFQDAHISADGTYSIARNQRVSSQKRERSLLKDQNSPPKKSKFEEHDSDLSQPAEKKLTATGHKQTLKDPKDSHFGANATGKDVSADDRQVKNSSCCEVKVKSAAEASSDKDEAAAEVLPANNDDATLLDQAFATFSERPIEENSSYNLDSKRLESDSDAERTLCGNQENEPLQMVSLELSQEGHALVTHSENEDDARHETPVQGILDSAVVLESRESDGGNIEVLDLNQVEVKADSTIVGSGLTCDMAAVAGKGTTESLGMSTDVKVTHAEKSLELAKATMEVETEQSREQSDVSLQEAGSSVSAIKSQEVCLSHMTPKEVDPAPRAYVPEQTKQAVLTIRKNPSIPVTFQPRVATTSKTWYRSGGLGNSPSASKLSNVFSANSGGANGSAYIRKGNSLVRASGSPLSSVSNPKQPIKQSFKGRDSPLRTVVLKKHNTWNNPKPVDIGGPASPPMAVGLGAEQAVAASVRCSSEVEKSPVKAQSTLEKYLPSPASDHAPVDSSSIQVGLPPEAVSVEALAGTSIENANEAGGSSLKDDCTQEKTNNLSSESSKTGSTMLYIRSKANQLVVSPLSPSQLDTSNSRPGNSGADIYYKRKTNQLVRNNVLRESSGKSPLREEAGRNNLKSPETHVPPVMKTKLGRVLSLKKHQLQSSWVWTLNKVEKQSAPSLLPWKRRVRGRARSRRLKALPKAKKGSLLFLMSKKLQALHKSQPLYTRSANGFSLRRSGVRSIGGHNLKWTKSLEKRSREANEEVTKVLAAVEKQCREESTESNISRRVTKAGKAVSRERIVLVGLAQYKMDPSRRTLQRLYESQESPNSAVNSSWNKNCTASALLTPGRSSIGGAVYVRMGNGNQLVRDPKASSRALASEKIRWSLHNVRSRVTKKQQYCQFFTRFGKCNKGDGKCPYVHDPEKVVVCTKFLKGTCTNTNCPLTHKVIPERMPDCSFFVQGLCINEECPYRHVNVNPQASVCEGFLKGYCASGDQCNKKHTYVCPVYSVSGDCPERKTCKFHHPKKKEKPAVVVGGSRIGKKRRRRYFLGSEPPSNPLAVGLAPGDEERPVNISEWTEFISLQDITLDDGGDTRMQEETNDTSIQAQEGFLCFDAMSDEDVERLIRPSFVLTATMSAAHIHLPSNGELLV